MIHLMRRMSVIALTCLTTLTLASEPAVVWVSQPVEPGEAVMVYGGSWTEVKTVELDGPSKTVVAPLNVTEDAVTFVYPSNWPRTAFTARIVDATGVADVRVNAPDVWWFQGDTGAGASSGGWLRVFGRSIGYDNQAFVELKGQGKSIKLAAAASDLYAMRVELPVTLAAGEYELFVNNGLDAQSVFAGTLAVAPHREPWPDKIFNVVDYGAVPNDQRDDSHAILAALAALTEAGGGILYFPRGRFGMTGTITLPPGALLRGEDIALSQIYWLDDDNPQGALVSGTYNFGIEEIFLAAGNIDQGIVTLPPGPDDTWKNENILLRRVRTRFLHTDAEPSEENTRRARSGGTPLRIRGDQVRILGCDFYSSKGGPGISGEFLHIRGNRFDGESCGHLGGRKVIYEENDSERVGISFGSGTYGFYLLNNKMGAKYDSGDRETFTFDGGDFGYQDTAEAVSDRTVTLKPVVLRRGADRWIGEPITIIGGRGAGQMRTIVKIDGADVEIDRPWGIVPDAESYFVIAPVRHKLLFVDNQVRDGNPFALYGSATHVVLAGNQMQRCGGLHAHGMYKGVPEPSWFVEFIGNRINEGNSVRGPFSFEMPANDSWIGFFDRGIRKPLAYPQNRAGIMRRNVLEGNAYLTAWGRVSNLLMENNVVRHADRGVVIRSDVTGAMLRGNRFEHVLRPHVIHDGVKVDIAERLLAGLSAAEAWYGKTLPGDWKAWVAEAEALAGKALSDEVAAKAAASILDKALRSVAAAAGDAPVPSSLISALLGVDVTQSSIWQFNRVVPGRDTRIPVVSGVYPEMSPPATLSGEVKAFEGWTARIQAGDLKPGQPMACSLFLSRPEGLLPVFTLPVRYTLGGEGVFRQSLFASAWSLPVTAEIAIQEPPGWKILVPPAIPIRTGGIAHWDVKVSVPTGHRGRIVLPITYQLAFSDNLRLTLRDELILPWGWQQPENTGISDWLVLGPFPPDQPPSAAVTMPDEVLDVRREFAVGDSVLRWQAVGAPDGRVVLKEALAGRQPGTVYAVALLRTDAPLRTSFRLESGNADVWVNGKSIIHYPRYYRNGAATLSAGDNIVLVKLSAAGETTEFKVSADPSIPSKPGILRSVPAVELRGALALFGNADAPN